MKHKNGGNTALFSQYWGTAAARAGASAARTGASAARTGASAARAGAALARTGASAARAGASAARTGASAARTGASAQKLRLCMIFCVKIAAVHDFELKIMKKSCTAEGFAQRHLQKQPPV